MEDVALNDFKLHVANRLIAARLQGMMNVPGIDCHE